MEGPDCNVAGTEVNDYSWTELQRAMGATDEEMAILQNFGTNSSQDSQEVASENCLDLLDLDNRQNANSDQVNNLLPHVLDKIKINQLKYLLSQEKPDTQIHNGELAFKCKACDKCYQGVAAFRIHSLDVHSIEDPELGKSLYKK